MSRYIPVTEYVRKCAWCRHNGWTDPYYENGRWYGFPPNAVISQAIPWTVWELLKLAWGVALLLMFIILGVACLVELIFSPRLNTLDRLLTLGIFGLICCVEQYTQTDAE